MHSGIRVIGIHKPALVANSLSPAQEKRTMRKSEV